MWGGQPGLDLRLSSFPATLCSGAFAPGARHVQAGCSPGQSQTRQPSSCVRLKADACTADGRSKFSFGPGRFRGAWPREADSVRKSDQEQNRQVWVYSIHRVWTKLSSGAEKRTRGLLSLRLRVPPGRNRPQQKGRAQNGHHREKFASCLAAMPAFRKPLLARRKWGNWKLVQFQTRIFDKCC